MLRTLFTTRWLPNSLESPPLIFVSAINIHLLRGFSSYKAVAEVQIIQDPKVLQKVPGVRLRFTVKELHSEVWWIFGKPAHGFKKSSSNQSFRAGKPGHMSFLMNQGMSVTKEAEARASPQHVVNHLGRNGPSGNGETLMALSTCRTFRRWHDS